MCWTSAVLSSSVVITLSALYISDLITMTDLMCWIWWLDSKWRYWSVWVFFLYTVNLVLPLLSTWIKVSKMLNIYPLLLPRGWIECSYPVSSGVWWPRWHHHCVALWKCHPYNGSGLTDSPWIWSLLDMCSNRDPRVSNINRLKKDSV